MTCNHVSHKFGEKLDNFETTKLIPGTFMQNCRSRSFIDFSAPAQDKFQNWLWLLKNMFLSQQLRSREYSSRQAGRSHSTPFALHYELFRGGGRVVWKKRSCCTRLSTVHGRTAHF